MWKVLRCSSLGADKEQNRKCGRTRVIPKLIRGVKSSAQPRRSDIKRAYSIKPKDF